MSLFSRRNARSTQASISLRRRPSVEVLESRVVPYATSGNAWPHPNLVTISFEPDGTNLGGVSSNLFATFNAKWATSIWENQILRAAQVWAQQTNLNFSVITDNGAGIGTGSYQQGDSSFGDIRIGGFNFGTSTLASAYLPPPVNNYSIAGDIQFNTGQTFNIGTTYDLFTVASHEIGHALGLLHSSVSTAVMYSFYNTRKTALASDDISGIKAVYSGARTQDAYDAAAANGTFSTATNLQSQISTSKLTALVSNLDLTTTSDLDYYTFTAPSGTNSSFTVTVQSKGLSLLGPSVTVYAADQTTVLGTSSGTDRTGNTLTLTIGSVSASQKFYVKVASADTSAFGTGAYALVLNFSTGAAPTVTPPNTQTLNGSPLSSGGGQPENTGHDTFPNVAGKAAIDQSSVNEAIRLAVTRVREWGGNAGAAMPDRTVLVPSKATQVDAPGVSSRAVRLSGSSAVPMLASIGEPDVSELPRSVSPPSSDEDVGIGDEAAPPARPPEWLTPLGRDAYFADATRDDESADSQEWLAENLSESSNIWSACVAVAMAHLVMQPEKLPDQSPERERRVRPTDR